MYYLIKEIKKIYEHLLIFYTSILDLSNLILFSSHIIYKFVLKKWGLAVWVWHEAKSGVRRGMVAKAQEKRGGQAGSLWLGALHHLSSK